LDHHFLLSEAKKAREKAYCPYSHFPVGAIAYGENGKIYYGCNIENAAYPDSMCAERTALYAAYADGCRSIIKIAVIADTPEPVSPCGSCRQVMVELCSPTTEVIMGNLSGKMKTLTVKDLLPGAFTQEDLHGKKGV